MVNGRPNLTSEQEPPTKTKKIQLVLVTHKRQSMDYEFAESVLAFFCDALDIWNQEVKSTSSTITIAFGDNLDRRVEPLKSAVEHLFAAFVYRAKVTVKEVEVLLDENNEVATHYDGYPIFAARKPFE